MGKGYYYWEREINIEVLEEEKILTGKTQKFKELKPNPPKGKRGQKNPTKDPFPPIWGNLG